MLKKVIVYYDECECCNRYVDPNELTYINVRKKGSNEWAKSVFVVCSNCRMGRLYGKWKYIDGVDFLQYCEQIKSQIRRSRINEESD